MSQEQRCNCVETSCKNDCKKDHTCKTLWCEQCKPEPKGWGERFDENYPSQVGVSGGLYITMYSNDEMKSFIKSVEQEALERGRKEERERILEILNKYLSFVSEKRDQCLKGNQTMLAYDMDSRIVATNQIIKRIINSLNGNE